MRRKSSTFTSRELTKILSERRHLSFIEQLELTGFLSDSVDCWKALQGLPGQEKPWEPEAAKQLVVRALRRVLHPRCDLTLSSSHLCLARDIQLPSLRFPALLLEEGIRMAERDQAHSLKYLKTPRGFISQISLSENWDPEMVRSLRVRLECASVRLFLDAGQKSRASAHLQAARRATHGSANGNHEADFRLAEFHLARGQPDAFLYLQEAMAHVQPDPIRTFEMASDGVIRLAGQHLELADVNWALSHLDRLENHSDEICRLSGLFHKANFVAGLQQSGSFGVLAVDIAEKLTQARDDIERLGDRYSLATCHQLLAELQKTSDVQVAAACH